MLWCVVRAVRKPSGKDIASSPGKGDVRTVQMLGLGGVGAAMAQSGLSEPKCGRLGGLASAGLA